MLNHEGRFWIYKGRKLSDSGEQPLLNDEHETELWYAIRTINQEGEALGFELNEGDIVKFGRVKFKVKEIKLKKPARQNTLVRKRTMDFEEEKDSPTKEFIRYYESDSDDNYNHLRTTCWKRESTPLKQVLSKSIASESCERMSMSDSEREPGACRFCFCDQSTEDNPIISPCVCTGSLQMIHKNCLADWVDSRKVFRSTKATDCYWW